MQLQSFSALASVAKQWRQDESSFLVSGVLVYDLGTMLPVAGCKSWCPLTCWWGLPAAYRLAVGWRTLSLISVAFRFMFGELHLSKIVMQN